MTKSDLRYGNVVELRDGGLYLCARVGNEAYFVGVSGAVSLQYVRFLNDLTHDSVTFERDIVKVYRNFRLTEVLWERKELPKLTETERHILLGLPDKYKDGYICRDKNGYLFVYNVKPEKGITVWSFSCNCSHYSCRHIDLYDHLFQFIKWEDEEPYKISKLLGGQE